MNCRMNEFRGELATTITVAVTENNVIIEALFQIAITIAVLQTRSGMLVFLEQSHHEMIIRWMTSMTIRISGDSIMMTKMRINRSMSKRTM